MAVLSGCRARRAVKFPPECRPVSRAAKWISTASLHRQVAKRAACRPAITHSSPLSPAGWLMVCRLKTDLLPDTKNRVPLQCRASVIPLRAVFMAATARQDSPRAAHLKAPPQWECLRKAGHPDGLHQLTCPRILAEMIAAISIPLGMRPLRCGKRLQPARRRPMHRVCLLPYGKRAAIPRRRTECPAPAISIPAPQLSRCKTMPLAARKSNQDQNGTRRYCWASWDWPHWCWCFLNGIKSEHFTGPVRYHLPEFTLGGSGRNNSGIADSEEL